MDLHSKQRILGASIWLLLLIIFVPAWYSNPVNFSPDGVEEVEEVKTLPTVEHAYRLPDENQKPLTDLQSNAIQSSSTAVANLAPQPEKTVQATTNQTVKIKESVKAEYVDNISKHNKYAGQWVVILLPFDNISQANKFADKVSSDSVYIKYFPKTRVYSVRAGPYKTKSKAEKAKQKLDTILRTNGEVRQLPKNS